MWGITEHQSLSKVLYSFLRHFHGKQLFFREPSSPPFFLIPLVFCAGISSPDVHLAGILLKSISLADDLPIHPHLHGSGLQHRA